MTEPSLAPSGFVSSTEEIIAEAANGRMTVIIDDEDRENEGDLVLPAQMVTPNAVNFMARHGRGLICLALGRDRAETLGLALMSSDQKGRFGTAFTQSIEARDGVTTGISAADRARTIAVAIDSSRGAEHIVSPGHIFPLIARDGGVLVRAGHTEAAVDVARLAGLNPSGVICEIMNDDGTMARRDDLVAFARTHKLKIGTIRDLIAYRRQWDNHVERRAELQFKSRWGGDWTGHVFYNRATNSEQVAIVKGEIDPTRPTMVRMHRMSHFTDVFGEISGRSTLLSGAMEMIAAEGRGVIVQVNRPMQGDLLSRLVQARAGGASIGDLTALDEVRDYGAGAQILSELGVQEMILLTNTPTTLVALAGYGLSIVEQRPIAGDGED
ncbi:3,4-dihydroxy-2-butanone-4-phosphate synthase [Sphingomonas sp.]|uniref:3,4-dihydroxy-2-butanone-4-phosphate synthase n=1 Tax=Sphingomonas sp. TaxID=28214 RepID=UPI00325FA53F